MLLMLSLANCRWVTSILSVCGILCHFHLPHYTLKAKTEVTGFCLLLLLLSHLPLPYSSPHPSFTWLTVCALSSRSGLARLGLAWLRHRLWRWLKSRGTWPAWSVCMLILHIIWVVRSDYFMWTLRYWYLWKQREMGEIQDLLINHAQRSLDFVTD